METLYQAVEEEAKQPIAVPNEQEDGCTLEHQQQVDHAEQVLCLCLFLFLFLFLCLYPAVGEVEVQPAAVPNELEDDNTEQGVRLEEKDPHCSHLANRHEN